MMMYDNIMLECGHKLRQSTFTKCHELGTCPRQVCLCPLSEKNKELVAQQAMILTAPMWELGIIGKHGRRANEDELAERQVQLSKFRPLMGECTGFTLKGCKCRNTVLISNGQFCRLHVPK